jgi:hypothetical protein
MANHEARIAPESSYDPHADSMLRQRLQSIAGRWPAVKFHPEDPHAAAITAIAESLQLTPVPSPAVTFRSVRGCALTEVTGPADPALEAVVGAVVAVATNPNALAGPTDPARNRVYAQTLLTHLSAAGWILVRA